MSGDHNPIHLYPLTAKALGFQRQIAHGMWSLARCVAALENRLPDAVTVDAAFKKPIFLPGRSPSAVPATTVATTGCAFALTSPKNGAPHLVGRTRTRVARAGGQRVRCRIRPSWATVATSRPSSVKTRASESPRAPLADGDHWS